MWWPGSLSISEKLQTGAERAFFHKAVSGRRSPRKKKRGFEVASILMTRRCVCLAIRHNMRSPRFLLRGFRSPRELTSLALGKLERGVLDEAWRRGQVTVRDIHNAFGERIAYTTLMTTLDRLYRKRLLDRKKDGRAFMYTAAVSRQELSMRSEKI